MEKQQKNLIVLGITIAGAALAFVFWGPHTNKPMTAPATTPTAAPAPTPTTAAPTTAPPTTSAPVGPDVKKTADPRDLPDKEVVDRIIGLSPLAKTDDSADPFRGLRRPAVAAAAPAPAAATATVTPTPTFTSSNLTEPKTAPVSSLLPAGVVLPPSAAISVKLQGVIIGPPSVALLAVQDGRGARDVVARVGHRFDQVRLASIASDHVRLVTPQGSQVLALGSTYGGGATNAQASDARSPNPADRAPASRDQRATGSSAPGTGQ